MGGGGGDLVGMDHLLDDGGVEEGRGGAVLEGRGPGEGALVGTLKGT